MKHCKIPDSWTPHEALVIAGFLEQVLDAIYRAYGSRMTTLQQEVHNGSPLLNEDDSIDDVE